MASPSNYDEADRVASNTPGLTDTEYGMLRAVLALVDAVNALREDLTDNDPTGSVWPPEDGVS